MHQLDQKGVVELLAYSNLVPHGLVLIPLLVRIARDLSNEFYGIELSIFIAAGQIHLAESSDGQTIVDLVIERCLLVRFLSKGVQKFCFLDHSFLQTEAVVEVDVPVN